MRPQSCLALLSLTGWASARPSRESVTRHRQQAVFEPYDKCPTLYIVGVRGNNEPRLGPMEPLVDNIMRRFPGSEVASIDYPAAGIVPTENGSWRIDPWVYSSSKTTGNDALRAELEYFTRVCSKTPIVLMGLSQGAHVVGDAVCGVKPGFWPFRPPVSLEVKKSIKAIIQLGDPSNRADIAWHKGTSTHGGLTPRQSFQYCDHMASTWASYCDDNDLFCDRGDSVDVHFNYVNRYRYDIHNHIRDRISSSVQCVTDEEL